MRISNVLSHMNLAYAIRGDVEYSESIDLSQFDIECEKIPSNEEFHRAAIECKEKELAREKEINKIMQYPDHHTRLCAIEKQLESICSVVNLEPHRDFSELLIKIKEIEK